MKIIREGRNRPWLPDCCVLFHHVKDADISKGDVVAVQHGVGILRAPIKRAIAVNSVLARIMIESRTIVAKDKYQ